MVDDNADMRAYLRRILHPFWAVETAADGTAALEAARAQAPDLVVADVMMPGLDGFELVEALSHDERTHAVPVILLSARAGEEARVEGLEEGAADYMVKPFSARELTARVSAHVGLAHRQREAHLQALNETLEERIEARTAQVHELAAALTLAEHRERHRIARKLHDDLQQQLYGIQLKLKLLAQEHRETDGAALQRGLEQAYDLLDETLTMTRNLSVSLSPPVLEGEGLTPAAYWLTEQMKERYGLEVDVEVPERLMVPREELRVLLFRTVRELLFNVVKHAGVKRATVELREQDGSLVTQVIDRGQGFTPEAQSFGERRASGFGLAHARERINLFGGQLDIESRPGEGTRCTLTIPLKALNDDAYANSPQGLSR